MTTQPEEQACWGFDWSESSRSKRALQLLAGRRARATLLRILKEIYQGTDKTHVIHDAGKPGKTMMRNHCA